MKSFIIYLSTVILTAITTQSCTDYPVDWLGGGDKNDQPKGSLSGTMYLYPAPIWNAGEHRWNISTLDDHSEVHVFIEGTALQTTTASDGTWHLENVPQGIYTIKYQKDGYTPFTQLSYQFVGGGHVDLDRLVLYQTPTFSIEEFYTKGKSTAFDFLQARTLFPTTTDLLIFYGDDTDVSHTIGTFKSNELIVGNFKSSTEPSIHEAWLRTPQAFQAGQTVYAVAYPYPQSSLYGYDYETTLEHDQEYWTELAKNKSKIISFVWP